MWTSTLHLETKRILLSKLLGLFYPEIYYSSLSPLQVHNVPRQSLPSPNWVRVRNRLAGICGSDLHLIFADADPRIAPAALLGRKLLYPGHEVVGEVTEIGDDVQHLQVGDRVVLQSGPNCLSTGVYSPCRSCEAGYYNLCEQGVLPGPQPIGGGWSEEMLLHEQQLFRLPKEISDEQAVLLEPTAVAVHAVLRHLPQPGDRVLIIGAGTIGLLTLQVIRALAPEVKVSVLARHASQREQAKQMGATYLIHPNHSYGEMQQVTEAKLYKGIFGNRILLGSYDIIYDTVGHCNTLYHALRWTRARATIVLVGVSLHMMHIDLTPLWHQQINLLGSTSHGMETWPPQTNQRSSTFEITAELMAHDRIHPEQLITHHFALTDYKSALITATRKARSHAIKVVFDYSLQPAPTVPNSKTPLPSSISTASLTTPTQKLTPATLDDHAKEALHQLRLSLRTNKKLGSRTCNQDQPSSTDMAQPTPVKNKQAKDTSSVQSEGTSETKDANYAFSFPDVDDTPTVRVRRKRGSHKRKNKPFV
jgi:threonine dehydrogenase-like Zn-dependent dehydrogenase